MESESMESESMESESMESKSMESQSSWQAGLVLVFYCLQEGTQRQRDRIVHLLYYLQDSTVSLVEPWQGTVLVQRHAAPSIGFSRLTETNLCWSGLEVEMDNVTVRSCLSARKARYILYPLLHSFRLGAKCGLQTGITYK